MTSPRSFGKHVRVALAGTLVSAVLISGAGPAVQAGPVGPDDLRVSTMGPDATPGYEAQQSKVAYNADTNQFLVVWRGDDENDGQTEIYGQLIDATTGATVLGDDLLIAQIGTAGDATTDAVDPAVAWNSTTGDFVVAYAADNTAEAPPLIIDTFEIYAQSVTAAGVVSGTPLRVSDMGATDTSGSFDARFPDIAFDSGNNQFLIVWQGDDDTAPLVNNETEIFGQLIDATASAEVGTNDVRLSDMGVDGATATDGRNPAVAFDAVNDTYLVAWEGNDDAAAVAEFAIYGQLVSPALAETGSDFTISTTGNEAFAPDIAVDTNASQFLVGWQGDGTTNNEFEVYASIVTAAGVDGADIRVSTMGPDADPTWIANAPAIAYDAIADEYVLVWTGDDNSGLAVDDHFEVYSQRLTAAGALSGTMERLSTMGDELVASTAVALPDIAAGDADVGRLGVVWSAENPPSTAAGESEIWAQLIAPLADIEITSITVTSSATPAPGEAVVYQIAYQNLGVADTSGVVIQSAVPTGVTIDSVSTTGPTLTRRGTTFVWDLALLGATTSGTITLTGTADTDAAGLLTNTASISSTTLLDDPTANNSKSADITIDARPEVTVEQSAGQDDPANGTTVQFTATFTEPVTGFDASDITLTGTAGATTAVVTGAGPAYGIAVSGMTTDGTVIVSIAANAANDADEGLQGNTASTSADNEVTYDATVPTVTVEQGSAQVDPTNGSSVVFDVEFSEPVSGFAAADVALSGSADATTAVVAGADDSYTVTVTGMTGDGTVVASVIAGAAVDPAGNASAVSTSVDNEVTIDMTVPAVTVEQAGGQADPTNGPTAEFTITFTSIVTGFISSDVTIGGTAGATAATVTGSGTTYTATVTGISADGTVTADVAAGVAIDSAGNVNTASTSVDNTVTVDATAPTLAVAVSPAQSTPTNTGPINFTVTVSEAVTGFDAADVSLSGTAGPTSVVVTPSGDDYVLAVDGMTGDGSVIVTIGSTGVTDAVGNTAAAPSPASATVDFIAGDPAPLVNDAPVVTAPPTGAVELGEAFAFTGADAISVIDVDALSGDLTATISAPASILGATTTGLSAATGVGTAQLVLTGDLASLNTALASVVVTPGAVGTLTVTIAVNDNGNTPGPAAVGNATVTVTITDTIDPVITVPGTVTATAEPGAAGATVTYVASVTDNGTTTAALTRPSLSTSFTSQSSAGLVVDGDLVCDPASGQFFPIGTTTVTCTATDTGGNTATATFLVVVTDDEAPTIVSPGTVAIVATTAPAVVNYALPTAADNSGSVTVVCTPPPGSTFAAGDTSISCTATDGSGNTAVATFVLRVSTSVLPATGGGLDAVAIAAQLLALGLVLLGSTRLRRRRLG